MTYTSGVPDEPAADATVPVPASVADAAAAAGAAIVDRSIRGAGVWIVMPTYNEADNLAGITAAALAELPGATLLVVDDGSPDGTGELAEELAAADRRIRVCHRARKQGLGRAYLEGFDVALRNGAEIIVQMDADWSHDPVALPGLVAPVESGQADLSFGSRYTKGGRIADWGLGRRVVSRGGSVFAGVVLWLPVGDLTGGFKAWRASTLQSIPFAGVHSGGYVFQIEMTYRARRDGARIVEVPITFRDRRVGASKMSRRIVGEALLVVLQLRWEDSSLGRRVRSRRGGTPLDEAAPSGGAPDSDRLT